MDLVGERECASRLCGACKERLPGRSAIRCLRCGLAHLTIALEPGDQEARAPPTCSLDLKEHFPWDAVITWVDYGYPLDGWIHALKFQRDASLAFGLGWGLAQAVSSAPLELQKRISQLDGLIPLPLSRQRLAKRGFNQAQLIAEALIATLRKTSTPALTSFPQRHTIRLDLLKRTKDAPAMSLLASEARQLLVKNAYSVSSTKKRLMLPLAGMRLGLIDDVMTTGSTLAEATRCLKAAGAIEVIALVAARTPK
jgi:ComF family protein